MAAVTICSDFGASQNKVSYCFQFPHLFSMKWWDQMPWFNIGAPQYIRQTSTDIKGEIYSKTIIVGDFNTPLTPMDRSSKQKINKETCLKWYIRWDGPHWYLQNISSKCRRMHLLLKCTWNILQDRPHLWSQIKPQ